MNYRDQERSPEELEIVRGHARRGHADAPRDDCPACRRDLERRAEFERSLARELRQLRPERLASFDPGSVALVSPARAAELLAKELADREEIAEFSQRAVEEQNHRRGTDALRVDPVDVGA